MSRVPLDREELQRRLPEFYSSIAVVDTTGSTNADLLARSADVAADRTVLIAEHQDAGRGRHARVWVSPARAQLAMSVLLRFPGVDPSILGWLPLSTGVAVAEAVATVLSTSRTGSPAATGADWAGPAFGVGLKWPNDVLLDGKKICGILAEVGQAVPDPVVVVGLGLNVSLTADELPVPTGTSLALAGFDIDRTELALEILRSFADVLRGWSENNWDTTDLAVRYRQRSTTIGRRVRAELPGGHTVEGVADTVDDEGRLLIVSDGELLAVSAGDVTHLRAVPGH